MSIIKKRVIIFLAIIYSFLLLGAIGIIVLPKSTSDKLYMFICVIFSFIPLISAVITKKITRDKSTLYIKPNFKKSWRIYLFSALVPGLVIFLASCVFYLIFPGDIDLSGQYLLEKYSQYGVPNTISFTPIKLILFGIACIFISPLVLPAHIVALGEEIGWRGYLLPNMLKITNQRSAFIVNGFLWGLAHAPIIFFGFNYGKKYWGAPITGILLTILLCIAVGIWLSYVTIKSESVLPAAIMHGSINIIGEIPVLVSLSTVSVLLGPNPTGFIGMIGLIIGAMIILLAKEKSLKHSNEE